MLSEILNFNREFVAQESYIPYQTTKYPDRKLAILTCMDTRLTHLLPAAMGLKNGEVKMIKNAGGVVLAPYDSGHRPHRLRRVRYASGGDAGTSAGPGHFSGDSGGH